MENIEGSLTVIFLEAKKEGVFKARAGVQSEWKEAHDGIHKDIIYVIAQSVDDMMDVVLKVGKDRLAGIKF